MADRAFAELEPAANVVIRNLKYLPEFADAKIAIIGGLTIMKYDVDFLITVQGAPASQQAEFLVYNSGNGKVIQIDMCPIDLPLYLPSAAVPISSISTGNLPYISELDLLVFKIYSCGMRPTTAKKNCDASDAERILRDLSLKGPIVLSPVQKTAVSKGLDDLATYSRKHKTWWLAKLGMNSQARSPRKDMIRSTPKKAI
ncbi:uncharacterized protein BO97DRAFT_472175 [Aspergillus homomorphus CBS 101889]|uniref:Uncharacterized protein n=1 Tax=Aspergillus homomorphus (strain CBS 101889) TaxID=1450537 RepID=A0A395HSP3_ASPHC|nr:hypothetical protein BO97DRAFT_472175 [Aspergillus homomorphus CBS 101889]RAL09878.1 hypothetical protein BO97DRAFT_472175 [Aspergillus homomorphus CBS 101889]